MGSNREFRDMKNKSMLIEVLTEQLAAELARESCKNVDIVTTAEGRSMLSARYNTALKLLKDVVEVYLS